MRQVGCLSRQTHEVEAFASVGSSLLSPSAVRSLGVIKKKNPNQGSAHSDSSKQKGVAFLYIVSCIADLDTAANLQCIVEFSKRGR